MTPCAPMGVELQESFRFERETLDRKQTEAQINNILQSLPDEDLSRVCSSPRVCGTLLSKPPIRRCTRVESQWVGFERVLSIHAPAWGATIDTSLTAETLRVFQSTPPHGGRLKQITYNRIISGFQSTPPHGGRPILGHKTCKTQIVSIHAPAWGGDKAFYDNWPTRWVSIHAPAWGATHNPTAA